MDATAPTAPATALTLGAVALRAEIAAGTMTSLGTISAGDLRAEIKLGVDSLWAFVQRPSKGALALRCAHAPGGGLSAKREGEDHWRMSAPGGDYLVELGFVEDEPAILRCRTTLTPKVDLLIPYLPRDLYPLSDDGDPRAAKGRVEAAQRGLNSGLVYLTMRQPGFGAALYFQDLTSLNPFFEATDTKPDGVVGGEWPELGYMPPASPQGDSPPTRPLKAGKAVVMSDALIAFDPKLPRSEGETASQFLDLLAAVYPHLNRPSPEVHDWPARAEQTLRDLSRSPKAMISHYGHDYLHPYTASEYPDSMVQLTVLEPVTRYGAWRQKTHPLAERLQAGLGRFYDRKIGVVRRYLPNVGEDKDADAVDSWYLYHPLMNLARLAKAGDAKARRLLEDSLDYAIRAARHFNYAWPIQYKIDTFEVITESRNAEYDLGQTDVGGQYAYLMLQAHDLFGQDRFLQEAKAAVDATKGMQFELNYQANLTAWGVVACQRLHALTGEGAYAEQARVFLASFFHNSLIWESQLNGAKAFPNFLGVTCLSDAPYMAMYECFESFAAFDEYLSISPETITPAARLLVTEYRRYALDRAWFYYPDALPPEVIAQEDIRNGHIDRTLSFPLEDLYADGQPAGQVGQEIYGSGAAFIFSAHAFHRIEGAPFTLFCDYPLRRLVRGAAGFATLQVDGLPEFSCALHVLSGRKAMRGLRLAINGEPLKAKRQGKAWVYKVPGGSEVQLQWTP